MNNNHYTKLKTNLRLAVNRLKLLEKKKTELALKSRREIADFISAGKPDRARIRVEQIIREDYLVEAMELLEMYCELLVARFGLIQQMKTLDDGLAEAISSLIWVAPRLQADVTELKIISDLLTTKYGKPYAQAARENGLGTVSQKLQAKLSVQAPPKVLVEKYMIEIAKTHNIPFEPDAEVMAAEAAAKSEPPVVPADQAVSLIDLGPAPPLPSHPPIIGFSVPPTISPPYVPMPFPPALPQQPPSSSSASGDESKKNPDETVDLSASAPNLDHTPPPNYESVVNAKPKPAPRSNVQSNSSTIAGCPELPDVPSDLPTGEGKTNDEESIDFDDLAKRFEQLKKKK